MGERLLVECNDCRDRNRCSDRPMRAWHTALYWSRGAEILPCSSFRADALIEIGYVPRSPLGGYAPEMRIKR